MKKKRNDVTTSGKHVLHYEGDKTKGRAQHTMMQTLCRLLLDWRPGGIWEYYVFHFE